MNTLRDIASLEFKDEVPIIDATQVTRSRVFKPGSLFITRVGDNTGRASIIKEPAIAHTGIIMTYFDHKKIYVEYVYWWFKTKAFQIILEKLSSGVAQKSLNQKQVSSIEIPLPHPTNFTKSLEIQRYILQRINTLMPEVHDARSLLEDMSSDAKLILDLTLEEIFNDDIRHSWTFNGNFEDLILHPSTELSPEQQERYTHLQYIGGVDIEKGTCRLLNEKTLKQTKERGGPKKLFSNAILYQNLRPDLRKVVYMREEGICSQDIIPFQIIPDIQLIPRFLMWFLVSPYFTRYVKDCIKKKNGSTERQRINLSDIKKYSLHFPSLEDQEQIVKRLDHIQSQVSEMQKILDAEKELLKQLEFSILDRAFRGEL